MGYKYSGGTGGNNFIDDVIDHTIADETTIVGPVAGDRYVIASNTNAALTNILHTLTMEAAGYVAAVPGDLGLVVSDISGGSGVLEAYDNVTREWVVAGLLPFAAADPITIGGGTGAGTLASDTTCGVQVAGDVTLGIQLGEVMHIRGGLNKGWYEMDDVPFFNGVNTDLYTAENVVYLSILTSVAHFNVLGSEWAQYGVDKVTSYDGANWDLANTPVTGTTALQTTLSAFIVYGGNQWTLLAATVDHTALVNLVAGDSGHTQFLLLGGRAGGQLGYGGQAAPDILNLVANSFSALTSNLSLADAGVVLHGMAGSYIQCTVGVAQPLYMDTTHVETLALYPSTTSNTDLGDATHVWQMVHCEELSIYDTTGVEHAAITRSVTDFDITANSTGLANLNLTGVNITAHLGDNAGVNSFALWNTTPAIAFQITSLGICSGLGIVSAFVGAADVGKLVALNAAGQIAIGFINWATVDHNGLNNLAVGDVHTQYALLAGRAGGQTLQGGTIAGNHLILKGDPAGAGYIDLSDDTTVLAGKNFQQNDATGLDYTGSMQATLNTGDITPTAIWTIALADTRAIYVETKVVGMKADGTQRACYHLSALVYRSGGGALVQGICLSHHTEESDAAWDAVIDTNGNNVRVMVTGVALTTIHWTALTSWTEVK